MAERQTSISPPRQERGLARRDPFGGFATHPLQALQRFANEFDRMFDDFGLSRRGLSTRRETQDFFVPDVEVFQKDNELVIRADLPGLKKDEVSVEISDDAVTIHGERRRESEEQREGYYRSERSYGSFYRTIPLPEGAITEQAKANFRDGVLDITLPAPPSSTKGRRLEITEASAERSKR